MGVLDNLKAKDVKHGYSFCLPVEALQAIDELAVAPHGVVHQGTINELGQLITKDCRTQDQSFAARLGGKSINDRCVMELLTPCMFGHALLRIIHFILHLRTQFRQRRIVLQKVDFLISLPANALVGWHGGKMRDSGQRPGVYLTPSTIRSAALSQPMERFLGDNYRPQQRNRK
jgi:hypothetical protein